MASVNELINEINEKVTEPTACLKWLLKGDRLDVVFHGRVQDGTILVRGCTVRLENGQFFLKKKRRGTGKDVDGYDVLQESLIPAGDEDPDSEVCTIGGLKLISRDKNPGKPRLIDLIISLSPDLTYWLG